MVFQLPLGDQTVIVDIHQAVVLSKLTAEVLTLLMEYAIYHLNILALLNDDILLEYDYRGQHENNNVK